MSDTNNPEPVETEQPTTEVTTQAPPVVGEVEPAHVPQDTPAPPPTTTEPPAQDWRDKRIATLTRRLRELQEKGVSTTVAPPPSTPPAAPLSPPTDLDALVNQKAMELSAVQDFNRRCDQAALEGRTTFGESEFNGRINNLRKLVDNTDPQSVQAYNAMLMAALETGDAPRLLHDLGADLNEAQRLLLLTPTKMAVELTKRAAMPTPTVSNAPRPINPVGTRPGSHERIAPDDPDRADHISTAEWMRRREEQVAQRRQNR